MWRSNKTRENVLIAFNSSDELIVYDCETTGLSPAKDRIIQIAAKKFRIVNDVDLEEIDEFEQYINPEYSLPPKIVEITGITDEFLMTQPTEDECFDRIREFFGIPEIVGGQNGGFDNRFMTAMYVRHGEEFKYNFKIDTLEMARDLIPSGTTKDYKLGTIAALYGADHGLTFHNAFDDVIATARLISVFVKEYEEIERLESEKPEIEKKVPTVFSLGYWPGYKGFARIYINTNIGGFYYDIRKKHWGVKSDNPNKIEEVDMESLKRDALNLAGALDEVEFARYRG